MPASEKTKSDTIKAKVNLNMNALEAGIVCWGRLRLEKPLPGLENRLWLATDLHTSLLHSVEFLSYKPSVSTPIVRRSHPSFLRFYRYEITESNIGAIAAFHPLLDAPTIASIAGKPVEPSIAFAWFAGIAEAVQSLHENDGQVHGAIVPSRIRAKDRSALLTGYPYARESDLTPENAFISPQIRSNNAEPSVMDDVFGLTAIAYYLFTGGASPPSQGTGLTSGEPDIETIRRNRRLPPTGWRTGWDAPLLAGLAALPSLRPGSARSLIDALTTACGHPSGRPAALAPAPAERRLPPWRFESRRGLQERHPAGRAHAPGAATIQALATMREELAELRRLRAELDQRQKTLAVDVIQIEASRARSERVSADLQVQRTELEKATADTENTKAKLADERHAFEAERDEFERTRMGRLAEREAQLKKAAADLDQGRASADQRAEALNAQDAALKERATKLSSAEQALASRARECEMRESALVQAQHALTELSGSSDPKVWKDFIAKISAPAAASPARVIDQPAEPAIEVDASPPIVAPPAASPEAPAKATLQFPDGRRLHLFSGRIVRFGRHGQSDFLLVAVLRKKGQPNLGIVREISRKHFEIRVTDTTARIKDGWSDEDKPSQHGICIDGHRVPATGAELNQGALLSVTARPPGPGIPHWKVILVPDPRSVSPAPDARPSLSAVFLQRLDDAPDDVCVLLETVTLRDLGVTAPAYCSATLTITAEGIVWKLEDRPALLIEGSSPFPGILTVSVGWLSPASAPVDSE